MTPLTLSQLWERSLELFLGGFKFLLQAGMCFARIAAMHVKFVGDHLAYWTMRISEWVDEYEPVRMDRA